MEEDQQQDPINDLQAELDEDERIIQILIEDIESLNSLVSPEARDLVETIRPITVTDNVYSEIAEEDRFADKLADSIAQHAGSWTFIIGFGLLMLVWISFNAYLQGQAFDPYPFILLNLGLSSLAALQAPVILMSQNRQTEKDRAVAQNDYQVNLKAELEIADLHRKLDGMMLTLELQHKLIDVLVTAHRQDIKSHSKNAENQQNHPSKD